MRFDSTYCRSLGSLENVSDDALFDMLLKAKRGCDRGINEFKTTKDLQCYLESESQNDMKRRLDFEGVRITPRLEKCKVLLFLPSSNIRWDCWLHDGTMS